MPPKRRRAFLYVTPFPAVSSSRRRLASPRLPSLAARLPCRCPCARSCAGSPAARRPPGWALGRASGAPGAGRSAAWLPARSQAARGARRAPQPAARAPRRPGPAAAARAAAAASSRSSSGRRGAPRTCTSLSSPRARSLLPLPLLHQLTPRERMTSSLLFQLPPLPPQLGWGEGGGGPRRRGRDRDARPRGLGKTAQGPGPRGFRDRWVDLTGPGGGARGGRGEGARVQPARRSKEAGGPAGVAAARAGEAQGSLCSVPSGGDREEGWVCSCGRRGSGGWV